VFLLCLSIGFLCQYVAQMTRKLFRGFLFQFLLHNERRAVRCSRSIEACSCINCVFCPIQRHWCQGAGERSRLLWEETMPHFPPQLQAQCSHGSRLPMQFQHHLAVILGSEGEANVLLHVTARGLSSPGFDCLGCRLCVVFAGLCRRHPQLQVMVRV
jgi:hypothetical protein